jgi:hypothetical protein
LRYIWIDALCIVQDDKQDKDKEIGQMGSIYKDATLTIMAASAKSAYDGFLDDAKIDAYNPFAAAIVDISDDDDVPLRDKRQRDGVPSSFENSFRCARAPSPPAGSVKYHGRGDGLVSLARQDIGESGSQSKLYVAIASAVII